MTDGGSLRTDLAPFLEARSAAVIGASGLKGAVKAKIFTATPDALTKYANGSMLDFNNPQLQSMLSTLTDQVNNSVGDQFAAAGRSFSGAHANALAKGLGDAEAPVLLGRVSPDGSDDARFRVVQRKIEIDLVDEKIRRAVIGKTNGGGVRMAHRILG